MMTPQQIAETNEDWVVAALYHFTPLSSLPALQAQIKSLCLDNGVVGTLLLAPEGINGTIAAPTQDNMEQVIAYLNEIAAVESGELKYSTAQDRPFRRLKVRLKKEIVTLRQPQADPSQRVGTYIDPKDWNALISDPEMIVIDTRNTYETAVGMFKGATDPQTTCFTQFPDFVKNHLDPAKHKKIAMYCTGGIRCEKASSYMVSEGFETVYHLKGGILKYLEDVSAEESLWDGACFVFDRRVAVGQDLEETPYRLCHGCRYPLSEDDVQHKAYEEGVSCPHCIDALTPEKARAFRMRHAQMNRASET